jgi:hypothetical protein
MSNINVDRDAELDTYVRAFRPLPAQRGAVVAIAGKVVGVEIFDSATAFSRYVEKLVRAYALDAIERKADEPLAAPSEGDARAFLDLLTQSTAARSKSELLGS